MLKSIDSIKPLPKLILILVFTGIGIISLISLGLTSALCDSSGYGYCQYSGNVISAGPVLGIISSLFSILFCGLAFCLLLVPFLDRFSFIIKLCLLFGFCGVVLTFSFMSGVLLAYTASNRLANNSSIATCGAASAFEFFLMISALVAAFCSVTIGKHEDEALQDMFRPASSPRKSTDGDPTATPPTTPTTPPLQISVPLATTHTNVGL